MKQSVLITICAMLFAACTPNIPKPIENAKADFTYTISSKTVTFKNASTPGLSVYRWYFGDNTYNDYKETISHTYAAAGSYEVILQCKDANGYPYECAKTITISGSSQGGGGGGSGQSFSKAYISGFKLYDAYVLISQPYFRFECIGHGLMGDTDPVIKTDYSGIAITPDNLPYTMTITPVVVGDYPNPFDWYSTFDIRVYYAANVNANGACILDKSVRGSDLDGKTEYIVTAENGTKVGILIEYR